MRRILVATALILVAAVPAAAQTERKPLLPRPQKISYGNGFLPLAGLSIRFASPPSVEDTFAAQELVRRLEEETGIRLPIVEMEAHGPAIVLDRTGASDPLPIPGEKPGPESRESYHIRITPQGGEVRARSSAGIS